MIFFFLKKKADAKALVIDLFFLLFYCFSSLLRL